MKSVLHVQRLDELAATVSLPQLVDSYLLHLRTVISAVAANLPPLAPPRAVVAGHALSAVVCACGLGERVASGRWEMVREALAHGATIGQVCAASGLEPDEICVGLSSWAEAQHRDGNFTDREYDTVLALVSPRPGGGGRW
ncbi:hypothetical protein [Pseudonocardia sp. TRM90224]|uniref:hypothetical protein n=1 Tax=Pseudonocardia sp. TRM90224 TaxID=2812678 RepID=UPI001E41F463|nr:hypothetical protein [Pseudonocardia sp. TRM90224]